MRIECSKCKSEILLFFLLLFFKVLWFDFSWCSISTFRPFSYIETYVFGLLLVAVMMLPLIFGRMIKVMWAISVLSGILFISNLIYFRTYYTAIPLSSYTFAGNMKGYAGSITASVKWTDVLFPLSTIIAVIIYCGLKKKQDVSRSKVFVRYFGCVVILVAGAAVLLLSKGGFKKAYERLQDAYTHTCGTPIYTVFGSLYYDYVKEKEVYTPEIKTFVEDWLTEQNKLSLTETDSIQTRKNCILILAESLESWVFERQVEGIEIMPYLNRLLKDSTTIYAPHVLSQVKAGRSSDAKLIINTGLLPIENGAFSIKYPHSTFPSIEKAMKTKYASNAHCYFLTADRPMVWNQNVFAREFGYDSLISCENYVQDEVTGAFYHKQLSDGSFMRQSVDKIKRNGIWCDDGAMFVQCVTYSGHYPFEIPDELKAVKFSDKIPNIMRDYMTVANYTDRAIAAFVEAICSDSRFDNTLIVITGDHESLATYREELCASEGGRGVVSDKPYTPLIILNAPKGFRYDKVMGQIDIYPTILQLLGLNEYEWHGLGRSILSSSNSGIAVDSYGKTYGNADSIIGSELQHLKDAWKVSDYIIRYDYFGK